MARYEWCFCLFGRGGIYLFGTKRCQKSMYMLWLERHARARSIRKVHKRCKIFPYKQHLPNAGSKTGSICYISFIWNACYLCEVPTCTEHILLCRVLDICVHRNVFPNIPAKIELFKNTLWTWCMNVWSSIVLYSIFFYNVWSGLIFLDSFTALFWRKKPALWRILFISRK